MVLIVKNGVVKVWTLDEGMLKSWWRNLEVFQRSYMYKLVFPDLLLYFSVFCVVDRVSCNTRMSVCLVVHYVLNDSASPWISLLLVTVMHFTASCYYNDSAFPASCYCNDASPWRMHVYDCDWLVVYDNCIIVLVW